MLNAIISDAEKGMQKSIEALKNALAKIRSGRAHPSLLDQVKIDYYGSETPLAQAASVSVEDSRTLAITPWDKSMVPVIEKAIMTSDLGLNPASDGTLIRVPMPPLTEETRKKLLKVAKSAAEEAKVSLRNVRREANTKVKALLKTKDITTDEEKQSEITIQKLTDKYVKEVDELLKVKEADLHI